MSKIQDSVPLKRRTHLNEVVDSLLGIMALSLMCMDNARKGMKRIYYDKKGIPYQKVQTYDGLDYDYRRTDR